MRSSSSGRVLPGHRAFRTVVVCLLFLLIGCSSGKKPNVVIIFLDDSGYADFSPFSGEAVKTVNVDQLAREGCRYTNFHVPQAICSASRASLLTGCYPGRTGVYGAHAPGARGLDTGFATLGEVFGAAGYVTAAFGKWHCGDQPGTRSHDRGFDETCGLMYSNDMWKYHPENPEYWGRLPLHYWENGKVTIEDVDSGDQKNLTYWYTRHAVDFIERHKDEPFLLYVPHSMPHVPIFCRDSFANSSGAGLYGDVITELDWSVGEINNALKRCGIEKNTIVVLTSDNGPWTYYGNHAGKTPFRAAKATSFEGGVRSACIIKYTGRIKPGAASDRAFFSIDLLPTLCRLSGVPLPDNEIDGMDVWDLVRGDPGAENPHEYYAVSTGKQLQSILSADGVWKLHLAHPYRKIIEGGKDGLPGRAETWKIDTSLFKMDEDPMESTNVIDEYPEVARKMLHEAEMHREKFYRKPKQ